MKARKKPVVIKAVQIDLNSIESIDEARKFAGTRFIDSQEHYAAINRVYYIDTLEGHMKISDGDYIIKGVNGEFYPCKPDIFEKTYDIIDDKHPSYTVGYTKLNMWEDEQ